MPYKDLNKSREYHRRWYHKRRNGFFNDKICVECETTENLQIHHRDPEKKESHKIWGWPEDRRLAELKKCDVVCRDCHKAIHIELRTFSQQGDNNPNSILTSNDVKTIRKRSFIGETNARIAEDFPVTRHTIREIVNRQRWVHID